MGWKERIIVMLPLQNNLSLFTHTMRFIFLLSLFTFLLTSCTDEACRNVDYGDHGNCAEGACQCDQGFELGANATCDTRTAERIAGVYTANSQGCNTGNHNITLQASNIHDEILLLVNLGNYSCDNGEAITVEAEILSPTTFKLEPGPYCGKYTISGEGSISDNEITLNFQAEYVGPGGIQIVDQCVSTLR